jgi:adenylate kinase family enzyme
MTMRILVTGYPNSGKTTIARLLAELGHGPMRMTDSLLDDCDWSELSAEVARWIDKPGPWIIEGVAVPRALRKWRKAHSKEKPPCDVFVFIHRSLEGYRSGQVAMAKGVDTVMLELWSWLGSNGVRVYELGPTNEEK